MTQILNNTPRQDYYIHRGAPKPIVLRYKDGSGTFDATLKMQVVPQGAAAFILTVGNGISLSPHNAVADAAMTAQLSIAQSRLIEVGGVTTFELQQGGAGSETVLLMGKLVGVGGANPDG